MNDSVGLGIIVFGAPLLATALVSWLLHFFVALNAPPARRAAWTAGIAYVVVAILCVVIAPEAYWWEAPLAAIPAALIAFWWWRNDFARGWIDDADGVPDGVQLANSDWRVGLMFVGAILAIYALRVLLRLAEQGMF